MSQEAAQAQERERFDAVQAEIATCMAGLGFQYTPVSYDSESIREFDPAIDGFGFATRMREALDGAAGEGLRSDPNRAHLEGLTAPERREWQMALEGSPDQVTIEAAAEQLFTGEGEGCRATAQNLVARDYTTANRHLIDKYYEALQGIPFDPEVIAAHDQWQPCMAAKGYSFSTVDDAKLYISDLLVDLSSRISELPRDSLGQRDIPEELVNRLTELADEEVRIALDDFECSSAIREAMRAATSRIGEKFLEDNG